MASLNTTYINITAGGNITIRVLEGTQSDIQFITNFFITGAIDTDPSSSNEVHIYKYTGPSMTITIDKSDATSHISSITIPQSKIIIIATNTITITLQTRYGVQHINYKHDSSADRGMLCLNNVYYINSFVSSTDYLTLVLNKCYMRGETSGYTLQMNNVVAAHTTIAYTGRCQILFGSIYIGCGLSIRRTDDTVYSYFVSFSHSIFDNSLIYLEKARLDVDGSTSLINCSVRGKGAYATESPGIYSTFINNIFVESNYLPVLSTYSGSECFCVYCRNYYDTTNSTILIDNIAHSKTHIMRKSTVYSSDGDNTYEYKSVLSDSVKELFTTTYVKSSDGLFADILVGTVFDDPILIGTSEGSIFSSSLYRRGTPYGNTLGVVSVLALRLPLESDVLKGISYGGDKVGTLDLPEPEDVIYHPDYPIRQINATYEYGKIVVNKQNYGSDIEIGIEEPNIEEK